jgi:hypothetical protein
MFVAAVVLHVVATLASSLALRAVEIVLLVLTAIWLSRARKINP